MSENQIVSIGKRQVHVFDRVIPQGELLEIFAKEQDEKKTDEAFLVCSVDNVLHRYDLWKEKLPRIQPFFAIKCHPDPVVIRALAALDCGFDCASRTEIEIILNLGVKPEKIIYANPTKPRSYLKYSKSKQVSLMTFDSSEELIKIHEVYPNAQIVLRILVQDPTASTVFGRKFGADPESVAPRLLEEASRLSMNVHGISFHVGVGCKDSSVYGKAIEYARRLFDYGTELGHRMWLLDVGGGYPGREIDNQQFIKIADIINEGLDNHFSDLPEVKIISEPGQFFCEGSFSLCSNIINAIEVTVERLTKKKEDANKRGMMYYINDGIYGSFMLAATEKIYVEGIPLRPRKDAPKMLSLVWGPTCASVDVVEEVIEKERMSEGDWIIYPDMGAYTNGLSTTFNGFHRPKLVYAISQENWDRLKELGIGKFDYLPDNEELNDF